MGQALGRWRGSNGALNRGEAAANISFSLSEVGLGGTTAAKASDVWAEGAAITVSKDEPLIVAVGPHSAEFFREVQPLDLPNVIAAAEADLLILPAAKSTSTVKKLVIN